MTYPISLLLIFLSYTALAQVPTPAPPQAQPILLLGGTAHLGTGEVINQSAVAFADGKIVAVTEASAMSRQ